MTNLTGKLLLIVSDQQINRGLSQLNWAFGIIGSFKALFRNLICIHQLFVLADVPLVDPDAGVPTNTVVEVGAVNNPDNIFFIDFDNNGTLTLKKELNMEVAEKKKAKRKAAKRKPARKKAAKRKAPARKKKAARRKR